MTIQITVSSDTNETELMAIAALIAVLRGDATIQIPEERSHVQPAPPAPAPASVAPPPPTEPPASESLIQQEAARATVLHNAEVDVNGIPWDERIHAGTKVKNADNSWRTKRGADPALVTTVTAELKAAANAAPASDPPPPPTEPGAATAADAATAFGAGGAGGASEVPPPPPAATAPPPPAGGAAPAAPAPGELTYPQILTRANDAGLDYDTLNALAVEQGLEKFAGLAKRNDMLPIFADAMEAKILELAGASAA